MRKPKGENEAWERGERSLMDVKKAPAGEPCRRRLANHANLAPAEPLTAWISTS